MFKELIDALRRRPLLKQMCSEMEQMLEEAVEMYRPIADVLTGGQELTPKTRDAIYATDHRINRIQRKIRKQLVEHLIVSPGSDVPISLTLMSITKDAERVGDICKNMLEEAEALGGPLGGGQFGERFTSLVGGTHDLFEPTARAFRESDKQLGQQAVERARKLARECNDVISALLESDLESRTAVVYALLARSLKRICLHLSNIASSVVMPLHRLDYFDEEGEGQGRG